MTFIRKTFSWMPSFLTLMAGAVIATNLSVTVANIVTVDQWAPLSALFAGQGITMLTNYLVVGCYAVSLACFFLAILSVIIHGLDHAMMLTRRRSIKLASGIALAAILVEVTAEWDGLFGLLGLFAHLTLAWIYLCAPQPEARGPKGPSSLGQTGHKPRLAAE